LILAALLAAAQAPAQSEPAPPPPLTLSAPILPLDQVRIGMKGYGLSVFHGTTIEPFAVEVVSVMRDFGPNRGVIWIRCPDERMQKSGPVAGMSGSPVYLWSDDEPQELGKGGRLAGAAAFGFNATKDCYFGVQPIELMLDVASRAGEQSTIAGHPTPGGGAPPGVAATTISCLLQAAAASGPTPDKTWRAQSLLRLVASPAAGTAPDRSPQALPLADSVPGPIASAGQVQPMALPVAVASPSIAQLLTPLMQPLGMIPVVGPSTANPGGLSFATPSSPPLVGRPPPEWHAETTRLEPGSVLSIPLAFGDMDLAAIGTATDVLPDGRVLGFGHAMSGEGEAALPMASGYVHVVIPSIVSSFKLGGSTTLKGAIVRDEKSAVVGTPAGRFATAPVQITVNAPRQPQAVYHYQVVHHKQLTPVVAAVVALQSLTAVSNLPDENTVRLRGLISFSGGRTLRMDSLLAGTSGLGVVAELLPLMAVMMQNPHESLSLESIDLTADVEDTVRVGFLVAAQLDRAEVEPGDTVAITLQIYPYAKPPVRQRIDFTIPQGLPDGDYTLTICDAPNYAKLLFDTHPHLLTSTNANDLYESVQKLLSIPGDSLYATLELPEGGLALGRQELPRLPSSRRALIDTPTNTRPVPYTESVHKAVPTDWVLQGRTEFTITVKKSPAR
jgi:hypothetical protein